MESNWYGESQGGNHSKRISFSSWRLACGSTGEHGPKPPVARISHEMARPTLFGP